MRLFGFFRSANRVTHAMMEPTTATGMPSAITLATSVTPCIVVNVDQAMLGMVLSAEKTLI